MYALDEVSIEMLHRSRRSSFQVLIMDEVDGVSGSEGRGGMQTLLKLFRTTRIPIICIANDRQASKMRTLISNCYEIKFDRPSFLNVKSYLLDICSREHIRITHGSLDNLIHVCNRDVRHLIHTLNLFYKQSSSMLTSMTKTEKGLSTSPLDACMKMFAVSDTTLLDKANLYFHDSSLMPLLIQENYLRVVPSITAQRKPVSVSQRLDLISKVADSLVLGDMCSKLNYTNGSRALMGYESMYSGVLPATYLRGSLDTVHFPAWFRAAQKGKTNDRLAIELETHCSLKTTSIDRNEFNLDYLPVFDHLLCEYLSKPTTAACFDLLNHYDFNPDDVQTIFSISSYEKRLSPRKLVWNSQVEALLKTKPSKERRRVPYQPADDNNDDKENAVETHPIVPRKRRRVAK